MPHVRAAVLGNAGTLFVFRVGGCGCGTACAQVPSDGAEHARSAGSVQGLAASGLTSRSTLSRIRPGSRSPSCARLPHFAQKVSPRITRSALPTPTRRVRISAAVSGLSIRPRNIRRCLVPERRRPLNGATNGGACVDQAIRTAIEALEKIKVGEEDELKMLDPVEAKWLYAGGLGALEERRGVPPLLPESTVCKSRGIYGNFLRLPRLIPPCGGTQADT
jgi:hypothetical protein